MTDQTGFNTLLDHWIKAFQVFIAETGDRDHTPLRLSYTLRPGKAPFSLQGDVRCINAYPLLVVLDPGQLNAFVTRLLDAIGSRFTLEFVEPHGFVLEDVQIALNQGHHFDDELWDSLILFGWCIQQYAARLLLAWKKYPKGLVAARFEQNGLYVRPGIVEMRALQSFVSTPDEARSALLDVVTHPGDDDFMYAPPRVPMWQTGDTAFNIKRLMTNAGFYTGEPQAWENFSAWCTAYFDALAEGTVLHHNKAFWYSLHLLEILHRHNGRIPPHRIPPPPHRFYQSLAGKKVLFVTPFAEAIGQLVSSHKLQHLYHDIIIPGFSLETLPAFVSTYPNRPHTGYRETLSGLIDQIDTQVARSGSDLFMASCGCYGLPLCHYVYRQWGITSVYMGNSTNTLFGILQKTSLDFLRSHRNEENWIRGDLGQHYKNLDRIDQGRYL